MKFSGALTHCDFSLKVPVSVEMFRQPSRFQFFKRVEAGPLRASAAGRIRVDDVRVTEHRRDRDPVSLERRGDLFGRLPIAGERVEMGVGEVVGAEHAVKTVVLDPARRFLDREPA